MRCWISSLALLLAGCLPSFDGFALVDEGGSADAGAVDAGQFDAGEADAGEADAGLDGGTFMPGRIDVACPTAWSELAPAAAPPCDGRRIITIGEPLVSRGLAITRADDGNVLVAYNEMEHEDLGRIVTVRFAEDAPEAASAGPTVEPEATIGDVVGIDVALATDPSNVHHLAYWLRSTFGHQVVHRSISDETLSDERLIASAVGYSGVVDVAVDSEGRLVFGWHDGSSGTTAARRERADGSLTPPTTIRTDGDARMDGAGAVALTPGFAGGMHMAFQWKITLAASAPSYSISAGETWSSSATLDNRMATSRTSGVGVDITTLGDEVVVAYLDWSDGLGELRFARFLPGGDVAIERYLEGIVADHRPGAHPIALATDAHGLLHLVVATSDGSTTSLEYHRQTTARSGRRWVRDVIAELRTTPDQIDLDMELGPDRRPHIAYWDPALGVRYATLLP